MLLVPGEAVKFHKIVDLLLGGSEESCIGRILWSTGLKRGLFDYKAQSYRQCCGSGSGRIRTFLPDPDISPPNPDPDPALVIKKKISVSVQYRAYVYLCTP
jgi:hypothetical protein